MGTIEKVHDPGLQQERTVLAWDRTALTLMVASGLLVRVAGDSPFRLGIALATLALLVGLMILIFDRRRYLVRWRRMEAGGPMTSNVLVTLIGAITVVLGATALWVVVLLWLR